MKRSLSPTSSDEDEAIIQRRVRQKFQPKPVLVDLDDTESDGLSDEDGTTSDNMLARLASRDADGSEACRIGERQWQKAKRLEKEIKQLAGNREQKRILRQQMRRAKHRSHLFLDLSMKNFLKANESKLPLPKMDISPRASDDRLCPPAQLCDLSVQETDLVAVLECMAWLPPPEWKINIKGPDVFAVREFYEFFDMVTPTCPGGDLPLFRLIKAHQRVYRQANGSLRMPKDWVGFCDHVSGEIEWLLHRLGGPDKLLPWIRTTIQQTLLNVLLQVRPKDLIHVIVEYLLPDSLDLKSIK